MYAAILLAIFGNLTLIIDYLGLNKPETSIMDPVISEKKHEPKF